ncbi:Trafficking protein particle complex subunit 10 [Auxenochlorella protothecoides]|uniref:Trafficking protein particle complex subunit 10 n=1 Tax=Auxenochlorella protothecoides TaxID=3075 RepID=A0A087SFX0_AUXPR|nr:Trafficking protein particle complex subunit 10 [Auxenochlorella protothecoides]KFM24624.1 Trafficking protein particle complex subunit 10 [Auxenochlorella protothecoides]
MSPPLRFTDLGVHFTCTVDDLSGTWSKIRPYLEARLPLRHAQFRNSLGVSSTLDELHLRYVNTGDAYVQRLRQLSYSPVTWFRNPFCQLVLFSCEDVEEYKRLHRPQIRAIADPEARTAVAPELVIAYVAPAAADSRATAKARGAWGNLFDRLWTVYFGMHEGYLHYQWVYDTMRRDFAYKRRDRCVRLDPPPSTAPGPVMGTPRGSIAGLEILEYLVREAVMLTFEARTGAYQEEIRRHMSNRLEVGWTFTPLFLIKDSLAVMLEAAGMYEDALREYAELDVCHADTAAQAQAWQQQAATPLPPDPEGPSAAPPDEVGPMWMPWPGIRRTALALPQVPDFVMRQFLFASQARILLKLRRWTEGFGGLTGTPIYEKLNAHPSRPISAEFMTQTAQSVIDFVTPLVNATNLQEIAGAALPMSAEAIMESFDWLLRGGPGQSQPPHRASGDAPAAPALHVALGSVFAAARAELDRVAAGRQAVDGDRAGVGEGLTRLLDSVDRSDPLRNWEGVSARFAALPAEGGRPPTPRRLHPAPDTASQDGEESLDAVDLDARAPSARSVTPRAQGEEGEGATASQGYGEAGEIVPAPHAVTEAGSRDPGSLVALVAHSRHISTTSLESASASGDDRQAGDAGVGVASAHFRRRSAVDTSAAEAVVSRPGSHTRAHGPGTPPLPGPGQGITARTHSAPPTTAPTVSDYLDPRFVEQQRGSAAVRRAVASLPAGFAAAPLTAGAADPDPAASLRLPSASLVPPTEPRLRPLCGGAIVVHAGAGERGGGAAATLPEVDLAGTESADPQAPAPHASLQLPDGFLRAAQTDGAASLWWWADDCARSAVASCALRVAPPFEVEWSAREVPGRREEGGRLLLGAALRCAAGNAVEVTGLALSPQPGARLEEGCEEEAGDLETGDREAQGDRAGVRARLEHGQTLHCSWLLRLDPGEGGRAGLAARLRQAARARPCELAAVRALLPGDDGEACVALDAGDGEVQACTFRHACTLELAPSEHASPGATIQSRLLGPMSACVGQPLTLCWRLERGPGAADGKDSVLHYEVAAQGPGWSPGSARSGSVRLGGRPGSIATVEAGWVPLLPGSFAAPRLTIQGVHCQVRDVLQRLEARIGNFSSRPLVRRCREQDLGSRNATLSSIVHAREGRCASSSPGLHNDTFTSQVPAPRPLVLVVSGPSGVGKDAVLNTFQKANPDLHFIVTATTRKPRPGEVDGVDYHFVSEAQFETWIKEGQLLEHALESLVKRVQTAKAELERAQEFDYVVVNADGAMERTVAHIQAILEAEKAKVRPHTK